MRTDCKQDALPVRTLGVAILDILDEGVPLFSVHAGTVEIDLVFPIWKANPTFW